MLMHEAWLKIYGVNKERRSPERKEFTITDAQVDAVDDTAGLQPVNRAGRERAGEHEWNHQF